MDNFRIAAGDTQGEFTGQFFYDSDVYKWAEAVSYALERGTDPDLRNKLENAISLIAAAQNDSGYLNTYFDLVEPEMRWTNLGVMHELYNAGHLFEAAVAHHRMSGEDTLLDVACRFADHIDATFGTDALDAYPGHPEVELGLLKLADATGEPRYIELARYFLDQRGRRESRFAWELEHCEVIAGADFHDIYRELFLGVDGDYDGRYAQDHRPIREQERAEGHAVRAMYLFSAVADLAAEDGDEAIIERLEEIWTNTYERRTYVTGGIGSSADNEGLTEDYDLPNHDAYAETCAAVGSIYWNQKLLRLTGKSRYADQIERVLYNGFLAGTSVGGDEYFYDNPLASNGEHHRQDWFECACCPPNAARLFSSFNEYVYLTDPDDSNVYISQFVSSILEISPGSEQFRIAQETDYPWSGQVEIRIASATSPERFALRIRVPGWCKDTTVRLDDEPIDIGEHMVDGFLTMDREWSEGEVVDLDFELIVERLEAHPAISAAARRVALRRGPLIYCVEEVDNAVAPSRLGVSEGASLDARFEPELLGGMTVIEGEGAVPSSEGWDDEIWAYRPWRGDRREVRFRAVPYYAWDHRESGEMRVWLWEL